MRNKKRVINVNPWGMKIEFSARTGKLVLIFPEYRHNINTEIEIRVNVDFSWVSYIRKVLRLNVLDKLQEQINEARNQ